MSAPMHQAARFADAALRRVPPGVTGERMTAEPKDTIVKDNCALDRQLDGDRSGLTAEDTQDAGGAILPELALSRARGSVGDPSQV